MQESRLSRFSLHHVEGDDAGRLVHVDADGVALATVDLHALSVVPGLETRSAPAHGPRRLVLAQAARSVFSFAPTAGVHHPDHHPAFVLRLPVTTATQETLLTHHLDEEKKRASQFFNSLLFFFFLNPNDYINFNNNKQYSLKRMHVSVPDLQTSQFLCNKAEMLQTHMSISYTTAISVCVLRACFSST